MKKPKREYIPPGKISDEERRRWEDAFPEVIHGPRKKPRSKSITREKDPKTGKTIIRAKIKGQPRKETPRRKGDGGKTKWKTSKDKQGRTVHKIRRRGK